MKRFLALFLAVVMLAAGNVWALAEEPGTPAENESVTPAEEETDPPVEEEPDPTPAGDVITIGKVAPGGTIKTTWSIAKPNNTQSPPVVLIGTTMDKVHLRHENVTDLDIEIPLGSAQGNCISIRLKNPKTGKEDVGTTIEDVLTFTIDGKEYTFNLVITYRGALSLDAQTEHSNISQFTLGQPAVLPMGILDPDNEFGTDYEVEVELTDVLGNEVPADARLLEIGAIQKNGASFTVSVTPIKTGQQHIHVYAKANGQTLGKGWGFIVSESGEFAAPEVVEKQPSVTENVSNSKETTEAIETAAAVLTSGTGKMPPKAKNATTAAGQEITVIPVKLSAGDAISLDTANLLGNSPSQVGLQARVDGNSMVVTFPGGFGEVTEKGRICYPMDYDTNPRSGDQMKAAVRDENARSEAVKAGGDMRMPTEVTVTLKTKLSGTVNVYYYNEITRQFTLLASPTVTGGRITFPTSQMGPLLLTTGTV